MWKFQANRDGLRHLPHNWVECEIFDVERVFVRRCEISRRVFSLFFPRQPPRATSTLLRYLRMYVGYQTTSLLPDYQVVGMRRRREGHDSSGWCPSALLHIREHGRA